MKIEICKDVLFPDYIVAEGGETKGAEPIVHQHHHNVLLEEGRGEVVVGRPCGEPAPVDPDHDGLLCLGRLNMQTVPHPFPRLLFMYGLFIKYY